MISSLALSVALWTHAVAEWPRLHAVEAPGGRFVISAEGSLQFAMYDGSFALAATDAALQDCLRQHAPGAYEVVEVAGRGVLVGATCVVDAKGVQPAKGDEAEWTWVRPPRASERQFLERFKTSPAFAALRRRLLADGLVGYETVPKCGARIGSTPHGLVVLQPDGGIDEATSLSLVGTDFVLDTADGGLSVHRRGSWPNGVCPTAEDYDLPVPTTCKAGRLKVTSVPAAKESPGEFQRRVVLHFAASAAADAGVLDLGDGWSVGDARPGGAFTVARRGVVDAKRTTQLHELISSSCTDWPDFQATAGTLLLSTLDRESGVSRCSAEIRGCELGLELPSLRKLSGEETCLASAALAGEASVPNEPVIEMALRECVARFPASAAVERALAKSLERQKRADAARAHVELARLKEAQKP